MTQQEETKQDSIGWDKIEKGDLDQSIEKLNGVLDMLEGTRSNLRKMIEELKNGR